MYMGNVVTSKGNIITPKGNVVTSEGNVVTSEDNELTDPIYCDFCKIETDHVTQKHICLLCLSIGKHTKYDHYNCNFCTDDDHTNSEHRCSECNRPYCNSNLHFGEHCIICEGKHDKRFHQCSKCKRYGHDYSDGHENECKKHEIPKDKISIDLF